MSHKPRTGEYRLERLRSPSLHLEEPPPVKYRGMKRNVTVDCGWGKILFGQTFASHDDIIDFFAAEMEGDRNLAIYIKDHHVLISRAPDMLFVDPSDTYRLWLHNYRSSARLPRRFRIRILQDTGDADNVNGIYRACGMLECSPETMLKNQHTRNFSYFVAEDTHEGGVIGVITGIDHKLVFNDPENGASFWSLAVDPHRRARGVGRELVRRLIEHYLARGREYLDLSVMHDNRKAVALYRSLGFRRVPVFVVKRKNEINRSFYTGGPQP